MLLKPKNSSRRKKTMSNSACVWRRRVSLCLRHQRETWDRTLVPPTLETLLIAMAPSDQLSRCPLKCNTTDHDCKKERGSTFLQSLLFWKIRVLATFRNNMHGGFCSVDKIWRVRQGEVNKNKLKRRKSDLKKVQEVVFWDMQYHRMKLNQRSVAAILELKRGSQRFRIGWIFENDGRWQQWEGESWTIHRWKCVPKLH